MLSKKNRLDKKLFSRVFKEGKRIGLPEFTVLFLENQGLKESKAIFVVSSSVSKKAVPRNKLKRRARHIFLMIRNIHPKPAMFVFIFKKTGLLCSFHDLADKMAAALKTGSRS